AQVTPDVIDGPARARAGMIDGPAWAGGCVLVDAYRPGGTTRCQGWLRGYPYGKGRAGSLAGRRWVTTGRNTVEASEGRGTKANDSADQPARTPTGRPVDRGRVLRLGQAVRHAAKRRAAALRAVDPVAGAAVPDLPRPLGDHAERVAAGWC